MFIPDFCYHAPATIEEACRALDASQDAVLLAGGTDLLVDLKQGKRRHQDVVSLTRIPELQSILLEGDRLSIGAAATHGRLVASPLVSEHYPAIAEAAATIATEQIRNVATVGGNLCTAASCSDTAPILIALEAELELVSSRRTRSLALEDFFVTHRDTALEEGEILTRVLVPLPAAGSGAAYEKFGLRGAASVAVASVAARVRLEEGVCTEARIVLGAVAPTPWLSRPPAALLEGRSDAELSTDRALLDAVGQAAADDAEPIDDLRGSAAYRRQLVGTLTRRALQRALERATERPATADGRDGREGP